MLGTPAAPILETARLRLRGWQRTDFEPYAAMLADPETARFITRSGRPADPRQAWAEIAFLIGHWQLLGHGLFVVEARATAAFLGRVGLIEPEGWPGLELAWALAPAARGRGFGLEAARAVAQWAFTRLDRDRLISIIARENAPSRRLAERLGETQTGELFAPLGEMCDVWALTRENWQAGLRQAEDEGGLAGPLCG